MRQLSAKILENRKAGPRYYKMRLGAPYLARATAPGQFIEVRPSDAVDPLLRRPFSVHRIIRGGIEILYEVVGKGTEILARRKPGELLDVIGPLGKGFDIKSTVHSPRSTVVLVAGGMGVAPLVALAEKLVHSPQSTAHGKKIYALIGAKTKKQLICKKEFKELGIETLVSTEDGSEGCKGFITEILGSLLSTVDHGPWTVYACGPNAMLKAVAKIAAAHNADCQVSLEEKMACGVGVCLGCPVKVRSQFTKPDTRYPIPNTQYEYKMVCKDGPVFNAKEIIW
ncbi:MAG: dihydroorotate dehydrogenase electron transfer subunit [Candidatus Omnitrophota bacterium]